MQKNQAMRTFFKTRKGVIFDFDGLLVDSEPFHYKAYNAVFEAYGHSLKPEEYWIEFTSRGKGAQGEIDRYGLKGLDANEIRQKKFIVYSEFCRNGAIKFFPSAERLLQAAKSAGLRLAIASGSRNDDIDAILKINGFQNTFHRIMGKESAPREKPAPDIFQKTAEGLGLDPGDLVVLEDAEKGLQASRAAGIPCVIVRNALNRNIEFKGAKFICRDLDEVIEAIG